MNDIPTEEQILDIGQNTESLGIAYLFFQYVWPVIIGFIVSLGIGVFIFIFLRFAMLHPLLTAQPTFPTTPQIR
jgi:uncharacterized integral membrane protein